MQVQEMSYMLDKPAEKQKLQMCFDSMERSFPPHTSLSLKDRGEVRWGGDLP